jgi:uncharacterized protein with PIN domain
MDRKKVRIRCYAELNDFLSLERRQKEFFLSLKMPVSVGEVIELLGIPLSEVDLVMVNSEPVERSKRLFEHDAVSIYPAFETLDISSLQTVQKKPLRESRFIVDAHLGKLARYLRMLGFDTLYRNDFGDQEIIEIAQQQKRIILSRDKLLLKSTRVDHGYYVRAIHKHDQLTEVVEKFDLYSQFKSFTRCMTCNSSLRSRQKESIRELIDPDIYNNFSDFFVCPECRKVYWKGSHFARMEGLILDIIGNRPNSS